MCKHQQWEIDKVCLLPEPGRASSVHPWQAWSQRMLHPSHDSAISCLWRGSLSPLLLLLKSSSCPAASLTAKSEQGWLDSYYFQLHLPSLVSEADVFHLKPVGIFVFEIIQQRNKRGRNCLQINPFGNEKDSNHKRRGLKLPSATKCYVGRRGRGKPSNWI